MKSSHTEMGLNTFRILKKKSLKVCVLVLATLFIVSIFNNNFSVSDVQHISESSIPERKKLANLVESYTNYTISRLGIKDFLDNRIALEPTASEPVINDVLSFQYVIDVHPEKCLSWKNSGRSGSSSLLIVMVSASENYAKRNRIRQSLSHLKKEYGRELLFLIGSKTTSNTQQLTDEILANGDIVQVNVIDSYANLTLKSVALLHWVYTHCQKADYILKSDDDNFINSKVLDQVLAGLDKESKSIYGLEVPTNIPERKKSQKHYVSHKVWPWSRYPFYLMGGAYIISRTALRPLLGATQTTPYFPFEDVYISGLCALKANISLSTPKRLYNPDFPEGRKLNPCFMRNTAIWQTKSSRQYYRSDTVTQRAYRENLECQSFLQE